MIPRATRMWRRLHTEETRTAWLFILASVATFTAYRWLLWTRLWESPQPPLGFQVQKRWIHELFGASSWDLLTAMILGLPLLVLSVWAPRLGRSRLPWLYSLFSLPFIGLLCAIHLRMLFDRGEALGVNALEEALGGAMSAQEAWAYGHLGDRLLVVAPLFFFGLLAFFSRRASPVGWRRLMLGAGAFTLVAVTGALLPQHKKFRNQVRHNPLQYGFGEIAKYAIEGPPPLSLLSREVSAAQSRQLALIDPQFLGAPRGETVRVPDDLAAQAPLNLVFVIMESTNGDFVFSKTADGKIAMPFLKKLSEESWWMNEHYSPSNSSHRSLFSIFTGNYPSFDLPYFCLTPDITIPTFSSFLTDDYERFLITPGDLRSYFPRPLLGRTGFSDLSGRGELLATATREPGGTAVHELDGFEPFLARLQKVKGPFAGIYYSYTPHFYYRDYGEKYRIMPDLEDPKHRYFNGLRFLDSLIETLVSSLKSQGNWDNTVLVVVGDHGEAFGEHGYFTHGNDIHQETIRAPLLIHFPGVAPRVVEDITSHVDILPTLLDALGIPFEPRLMAGESLWRPRKRKYVFSVGNERAYASVSQAHTKIIQNHRRNYCKAYDLAVDPKEQHILPCSTFPEQMQALSDFRLKQTKANQAYSESQREGRDFFGLKHPNLRPFLFTEDSPQQE